MIKHSRLVAAAVALLVSALLPLARAAQTDLASSPLASTTSAQVKPNIMLLMDTSGSMGWGHMPDEVESVTGVGSVGYKTAKCNILYFNPTTTYLLPKKPDGTLFPAPPITAAPYAGYVAYYATSDATDQQVIDLTTGFQAYDAKTIRNGGTPDTPQPGYYYTYDAGTQTLNYASAPCTDTDTGVTKAATGGGTWTRHDIRLSSPAEQANFAVWYSYYRIRISLTKSAASLAFTPLTDTFRVGFLTVQPKSSPTDTTINPAKYLAINDFNSVQRNSWFAKLFSQVPGGASPAREGLARVGRMYAGKHDGINGGMTDDPVQYSCQQNFTIMTTDGYWNAQTESPGGGPVMIDGTTLVGQQDGTLDTTANSLTPRPIWDGTTDGTGKVENYTDAYAYAACGSFAYLTQSQNLQSTSQTTQSTTQTLQSNTQQLQSTSQILATTTQMRQSTLQVLVSTSQALQSTSQILKSTNTNRQSTTQTLQSTSQPLQSTLQKLQSTNQNLQSTSQGIATATQTTRTVTVDRQSTVQNLQSTAQTTQSTSQTTQTTSLILTSISQLLASTVQNLRSTTQIQQTTTQNLQSTNQNLQSTSQNLQSTSQTTKTTSQNQQSTLQIKQTTTQVTMSTVQTQRASTQTKSCDARSELCTYVAPGTCTPSGFVSCDTTTTGPALVANCNPQTATAANNYRQVTCTSTTTGPTGVATCTPSSANGSNNFTTTTCNTVTSASTPVASCTTGTASSSNSYTSTACNNVTTGPTVVNACSPSPADSSNSYTSTSCNTVVVGPTGVASCTASPPSSSNNYTTTTCATATTTNVPVANCTPAGSSPFNSYTTVTCSQVATNNVPVATCTGASPSLSNGYTTVNCSQATTTNVPVATCTPASATSPSFTSTTCSTAVTGPAGAASCTPSSATAPNYIATTCTPNNTTNVPIAVCVPSGPTPANGYTNTTCPAPNVTTDAPAASCNPGLASSANNYTTTTCRTSATNNSPSASCTAATANSTNSYTATTCATTTTGPTGVQNCTPSAATSPNFVATTCAPVVTSNVPVATCVASGPTALNQWVNTTCASNSTSNVPVASCTQAVAGPGNSYTATNCSTNNTSNVAVASCVAGSPTATNGYTTTTCSTTTLSGPSVVASCTPDAPTAANGYQRTTCGTNTSSAASGSCTPVSPTAFNNYTTVTCGTQTTTNVPVVSCTASPGTILNNYTTTTCPAPITTTNVPVASCAAAPATSPNFISVTCPTPISTSNVPVASCNNAAALSTNNFVATTCSTATTGPTGVPSCTPIAPNAGNNFTTTSCATPTTNNVAVAACVASGPTALNQWVTTTCPPATVTTDVPSASCTPALVANTGNGYTTTTCRTATTTGVPVASCTASPASATNNYVATSCPQPIVTVNVPALTCTPSGANAGNNFTATTCPAPLVTVNVPVLSCVASDALSGNLFVKTSCNPVTLTDQPVASCTPALANSFNNYTTTNSCRTATTTNVPVASCTASAASSSNSYTTTTCSSATLPAPVGVASCTPVPASAGNNFVATVCTPNNTTNVAVASCTPATASAANNYTGTTCGSVVTTNVPVASCTPVTAGSGNSFTTTTCGSAVTGPTLVNLVTSSCTPQAAAPGNNFVAITCSAPLTGKNLQFTQTHTITTQPYSGGNAIGAPVVTSTTSPATPVNNVCYQPGATPGSPGQEPQPLVPPNPDTNLPQPPTASGCTGWPCTTTLTNPAGSTNSLADVAQYYYKTDLRPATDWPASISANNVPSVGSGPEDDKVPWQHMTTFAIGLGVSGTLKYQSDYLSSTTGDFASIRTGVAQTNADGTSTAVAWPLWPDPALDYTSSAAAFDNWNNPKSIDDFWHTAVNGRGKYFSAGDPTSVINGLGGALVGVQSRLSSGAAAGISTAQPVAGGDNRVYVSLYTTKDWTGDVQSHDTDLATGLPSTQFWSAQGLLDAKTGAACDSRNIYLIHGGSTLVNFSAGSIVRCDGSVDTSTGLDAGELGNFTQANAQLLSQWPSMSVAQQAVTPGLNLVNFLRGQRGFEGFSAGDVTKLYRSRRHVLGDVVDAQPVIVKDPSFGYSDAGYGQFAIDHTGRTPMVYVAANDGMLHAFYAGATATASNGGQEAWAVVPSTVLPLLYRLADNNYANVHQFSVDGTPVVADARGSNGGWRTILVAGLNDGGKGYYALDVTDPATPRALWEFKAGSTCHSASEVGYTSDCYLGYSFGKPVVSKLPNGTWVAMFTSGYNNVGGGSGDGIGYLYVVDAISGAVISRTSTGVGSAATPSGLAQINNYVENGAVDNTTVHVYGGDLLGNVWRFDFNGTPTVTLVGTAKDRSNTPQSITVRPELAEYNGKPMVLVGTGRLLGPSDIANLQVQSIYGIVDQLTGNPVYGDLRGALAPLTMTLSSDGQSRTIACSGSTTACGSTSGWVADFSGNSSGNPTGERVNIQMNFAASTLVIGSNIPQNDACSTGGRSWLTSLDFQTGLAVTSTGTAIVSTVASSDSLMGGFNVIRLPSGNYVADAELAGRNSTLAGGSGSGGGGGGGGGGCVSQPGEVACVPPVKTSSPPTKRISWREILQ